MTRILVHAGFYKTGTTSLQDHLSEHREALAAHVRYYGPGECHGAGVLSRDYAQRPFPWRLRRFRIAVRRFLSMLPDPGPVPLVLSRENFTGVLPGHRDWRRRPVIDFPAAPKLLHVLIAELQYRFGPQARLELILTTRSRESWLASVHGHLLRSIALTDDLSTFSDRFPPSFSLADEAAHIAATIAPIPVHCAALEDLETRREGPAAALLDLLDLPCDLRAILPEAQVSNAGDPEHLRQDFLALNRKNLPRVTLKSTKSRLMRQP